MASVSEPVVLHTSHGSEAGPELFSPKWVAGDLIPFLVTFVAIGVGGSLLLFGVLYVYDRFRFDHRTSVSRAYSTLWVAMYLLVVGIIFGGGWDKKYHATNPFETFYSGPHLFVYASVGAATVLVACLVMYYGPLFRSHRELPFGIPASLGVLVVGLGITGFAGVVFDNIWHTLFGLNETPFSAPHMMIDWGKLVSILGFGTAAVGLSRHREVSGWHRFIVAYFLIVFSITPFTGSFGQHLTIEHVQGVLATLEHPESGLAQAFAVLEAWHLVRTNPVAIVLGGIWAGCAVGFLCPYLGRTRTIVGVVGIFTFLRARNNVQSAMALGVPMDNPAAWLPFPLIIAVIVYLAGGRLGLTDFGRSFVAGGAFSLIMAQVWSPTILGVVTAAPAATLGFVYARRLGEKAHTIVEQPTRRRVRRLAGVAVAVPIATGVADLMFRGAMG